MYAIIAKDNGDVYDVISVVRTNDEIKTTLDAEWDKNLPIIGMDANNHKETATKGATWNGTSFDGVANEGFFALSQEEKDAYKQYVFLCENKVVYRVGVQSDSPKAELFDAAFTGEVLLIQCAFVLSGSKVVYNKTTREVSAVAAE